MVNAIMGPETEEDKTDGRKQELRRNLAGRAAEYLMFMDEEEDKRG